MKSLIPLLLLPGLSLADPGEITRYLMNEPASMFELSLTRLRISLNALNASAQANYLAATSDPDAVLLPQVRYDFRDDKITAGFRVGNGGVDGATGCRFIVSQMRVQIQVFVGIAFTPTGYDKISMPEDTEEQVWERVVIECVALAENNRTKLITVSSPLTSDEISVINHED